MLKTKESKICKLISFVLAVVILAASVPFGPNRFATGAVSNEAFCIQIVEKGAVAEKEVECSFYNTDSKLSGSGKTASNGIWETEYIIGSSYNGDNDFTFVVDGKEVSTNINSMIDDINNAAIKGQQVIGNIEDIAAKYPSTRE